MAAVLLTFLAVLIINGIDVSTAVLKSEQYCSDVYSKTFSLDNPSTLIEEFPCMAAIGYKDERENIIFECAGTLISEKYVMTAAHCLHSRRYDLPFQVKLGISNLKSANNEDVIQTINISKVIEHPDYKAPSQYNDVGLIELLQPVKLTKHVKPICLETVQKSSYPSLITASLGILEYLETARKNLQKFYVKEYSNENCGKYFHNGRRLKNGILENSMICAGNPRYDPCVESGNPLITVDPTYGYKVVGVATFGKVCGVTDSPTVFYRVSHFVDWIESVVWP